MKHENETRNPKPETRNPKPETRNPKLKPETETPNPKPETRNARAGVREHRAGADDPARPGPLGRGVLTLEDC